MSEENKEEVPAFRISPKRVDDSWKEEVRREREAAARVAAGAVPAASPAAQQEASGPAPKNSAAPEAAEPGENPKEQKAAGGVGEQQQTKIFMTFLAGLAQQCLMQMGEMESPYSGQREMDMQGARYTIELLATIQNKTKNNLSPEESEALNDAIHDLKIRYIEITQELQRQVQAKAGGGAVRPGPGGSIPGMKR